MKFLLIGLLFTVWLFGQTFSKYILLLLCFLSVSRVVIAQDFDHTIKVGLIEARISSLHKNYAITGFNVDRSLFRSLQYTLGFKNLSLTVEGFESHSLYKESDYNIVKMTNDYEGFFGKYNLVGLSLKPGIRFRKKNSTITTTFIFTKYLPDHSAISFICYNPGVIGSHGPYPESSIPRKIQIGIDLGANVFIAKNIFLFVSTNIQGGTLDNECPHLNQYDSMVIFQAMFGVGYTFNSPRS